MKSPIKRSTLLYKYDTRNKASFHQYIDNIKNLCLVVRTPCAIFAGFYPGIHKDNEMMNKGGLLVSLDNDESYTLHRTKANEKVVFRGMMYDEFYVIFGNAEIRIKIGENKVFSNFGINNGFFDTKGKKRGALLNEES